MTLCNAPSSIITSRNHASIKRIRNLQLREERDRTGLCFVEGMRFVASAVNSGARLEALLVAPKLLVHRFAQKLVRQQQRAGVPCLEVTPEVFHSVAACDEPQGVGAVVRQRWEPLARVRPDQGLCWIALGAVQSAGNLGTMVRTAEAVGGAGFILIDSSVDPYDPAAVRATMGAQFSQRFIRTTLPEFQAWARRRRCCVVGTSPSAETDYQEARYPRPTVLFMGWERQGLSPEQQAACDRLVRIPMVGRGDSLNLAIATSVMLYEVFNQRRREADYSSSSVGSMLPESV
jgi:TrmH family RNA methyltransferase